MVLHVLAFENVLCNFYGAREREVITEPTLWPGGIKWVIISRGAVFPAHSCQRRRPVILSLVLNTNRGSIQDNTATSGLMSTRLL